MTTTTEAERTYRPLLDILTEGRTLPDGWKVTESGLIVRVDL